MNVKIDYETMQDAWDSTKGKGLEYVFFIWQKTFPCPKCNEFRLDFSAPRLKHAFICTNCHTLFDFKQVDKKT